MDSIDQGPPLNLADDWRRGEAPADCPCLFAEEYGRLRLLSPSLELLHDYGAVGPVDCPIAYDFKRRMAFRYVCASGAQRGDFSQLRAFSIDRRESFSIKDLPPNQWALWLLEWVPGADDGGQLFGLVATDRPNDAQVVIEHRLFSYKPGAAAIRPRALCRDAYKPLALSRQRRELVFSGADGIYLLNLRGERKLTLPSECPATGFGAAFDPTGQARVILGGDGLHLWDLQTNHHRRLTRNGRHPVWALDGRSIFYRESSGDLFLYDLRKDRTRKVMSFGVQRHPEFWHARPVVLSPCGHFLAASLSEKVLRGVSRKTSIDAKPEKVFVDSHMLVVLDLTQRTYWMRLGHANHLRWTA